MLSNLLNLFNSSSQNNSTTTESTTQNDKTSYVGFCGGPTYGCGFTYKKVLSNGTGYQVAGLPYISNPDNSFFAGGVNLFKILNKGKYGNLLLTLGSGAYRRKSMYTSYIPPVQSTADQSTSVVGTETTVTDINGGFGIGPAIGMEINFAENFTFSIELPIAFIFSFKDDNISSIKFSSIYPIPNVSLLYRF